MLDKKSLHEMERHMSILTAPNYNLHIILREYLTGSTHSNSQLILNSRGSRFKNKQSSKFLVKVSEFEKPENVNQQHRSKNDLLSSEELKFLENSQHKTDIAITRKSDAEDYAYCKQSKVDYCTSDLLSKSADTKKSTGDIIDIKADTTSFNEGNANLDHSSKPAKSEEASKNNNHKNLMHKLNINNLQKHKRLLQREVKRLKTMIEETKAESEDTNKKCNIVIMEKIELIEESEAIDVEINVIQKQKAELTHSNNSNSTEGNLNTVNSDPFASTREMSKGSNLSCNTAPNVQGIDMNKIKKIDELKAIYSNMEKGLEDAKAKAKEKGLRNAKLISENNDLKLRIDQKTLIIQQYKSEIANMKKKIDEKKGKDSTPSKIFGAIKSIFKK